MANYIWQCHDCKLYWDRDYPVATNPCRTKCPQCRKLCDRKYTPTPVHFKGAGWDGPTGFNMKGGSDEINMKLQDQCKERMKTGWQSYAHYEPSEGWLDANVTKKRTEAQAREKYETHKKITDQVYDKAGIDRTEVRNSKPQ